MPLMMLLPFSDDYYLSFFQLYNLPSNDVVSSFSLSCSGYSLLDPNSLYYSCSYCMRMLLSLLTRWFSFHVALGTERTLYRFCNLTSLSRNTGLLYTTSSIDATIDIVLLLQLLAPLLVYQSRDPVVACYLD